MEWPWHRKEPTVMFHLLAFVAKLVFLRYVFWKQKTGSRKAVKINA